MPFELEQPVASNLVQHLRVENTDLVQGEDIIVRSVLRNLGVGTDTILAQQDCLSFRGLDVSPEQPLDCEAFFEVIAPGDSVVAADRRRVLAGPGEYILEIGHVAAPEVWVRVPVRVRVGSQ